MGDMWQNRKETHVALFLIKQVFFPTILIIVFGFLFCDMLHINDGKWSKHKSSKDGLIKTCYF